MINDNIKGTNDRLDKISQDVTQGENEMKWKKK